MSKLTQRAADAVVKELRGFGLGYPGAHTKSPWPGHLDLAVNDKTFAYLNVEGEPNRVVVGGGTPRRVHSRPNAAMARGWARKNAGSFQTRAISSSRSSGVGAPVRGTTRIGPATLLSSP